MTTTYLTIMMKHFEQMQIDVAAASETILDHASLNRKETAYDCNRFLFIKEGEGQLLVRGDAFPLAQGKFFILLAGIPHRIALEPGQSVKLQWCHFREYACEKAGAVCDTNPGPRSLRENDTFHLSSND